MFDLYDLFYSEEYVKIAFKEKEISYETFSKAILFLLEVQQNNSKYGPYMDIVFNKPSYIVTGNSRKLTDIANVYIFIKGGIIYYSSLQQSRTFQIGEMEFRNVKELILLNRSMFMEKKKREKGKKVNSIFERVLKERYDNETWSNLSPIDLNIDSKFYNIEKSCFPDHVYIDLENAFKNKLNYTHTCYGDRYYYSVYTELGGDGLFRAFYIKKTLARGLGKEYFLLNPKIAVYRGDYLKSSNIP